MHERHEGMEAVGKSLKEIARQLRGGSPDMAVLRASAGRMENLARRSAGWFRPGTGPNVGKTGAKAEIWQQPQDFAAKQRAFQQSAQAFNAAVRGGDLAAINTRLGELDRTCKACHDSYRAKMNH
jgi:cytochrome c556